MDVEKADIKYIPGMGPKRAEILEKELGIRTVADLIGHFPYKYIDRSKFYKIKEIESTQAFIQVKGVIKGFRMAGEGRASRLIALFTDGEDFIEIVFFKGTRYVMESYKVDTPYIVFGKPGCHNGKYSFVHPDIEKVTGDNIKGFMPLYHTTEKMKDKFLHSKALQKLIYTALIQLKPEDIEETLPPDIIEANHLIDRYNAIVQVHFPQNAAALDKARYRLKFEELFYVQLAILKQSTQYKVSTSGYSFPVVGDYFRRFHKDCLPFELTGAQKRVIREIYNDVRGVRQMNRLVQGDVGSGKTIVALFAMLLALDNGYQACIVAPTEILATQHFEGLSRMVEPLGVNIRLLTGSTRKKEREQIHTQLQDGSLQILVGTHAVFEDTVRFRNLAMVVIDEQHRFGVAQRAKLWSKNSRPPHVLVMTATPIPRTLAMTLYGDLDVSVIDELPPGRKPIGTYHIFEEKIARLYEFMRKQMNEGRQCYVVYPLIKESEKIDLRNLEDGFEGMRKIFPEFSVSMVHGKQKPAEKEAEMQKFVSGETNMLVATTVIEVGVNVPNASVMVIQNAERFGLAQLHQLRGRVGRGADQSYCMLVTSYELSQDTRRRIDIMCQTNDGFEIAEADLRFRGPGELDGTLQSGLPFDLHIADLSRDGQVLQEARNAAAIVLKDDPKLTNPANKLLVSQLYKKARDVVNWSAIS